jgi:phosphoserine aminotransferase
VIFCKIILYTLRSFKYSVRSIPDSYAVLFLQGGATGQFSAIPLNFLNLKPSQTADYLVTGYWSEKAAKEAEKYGKINWVVPKQDKYQSIETHKTSFCHLIILFHRCSS